MHSRFLRAGVVTVAASAALAAGLTSASAAAFTYTVAAGSAPASGRVVPITGTTTGATPQVRFTDTTAGLPLTCDTSTVAGRTTTGTALSGTKLGTVTGTTAKFTNCKGPFGLAFVVTGKSTWNINATGRTTAAGATAGNISAVNAHVADGTSCAFDVTGTVAATYTNGATTSSLKLPGTTSTLVISGVTGSLCSAAGIQNGDKASFKGVYSLKANTAAYNPVTVKSN